MRIRSISLNDQPRNPSQRRAGLLSGSTFRSSRLGSVNAPQAVQAGLQCVAGPHSICQAAAEVVARADCWLAQAHLPREPLRQVSHETIYRSLYIQARGVLKKELLEHLRASRTIRRSRHATMKRSGLGQITDAISISERPASVEDRAIPGHWEGDLIGGSKNSYIATLVERHSRYVMLIKVANKDTESVVSALIRHTQKLPGELYQSLTWDRGKELADHQRLAMATDIEIYFCDPRSPWQRGSNENTNRLLRQYLPRGTDLSVHSQAKLSAIARQLNERPRKTLLYQTPAERFAECVAAIN
jgi:IS30 family transposase